MKNTIFISNYKSLCICGITTPDDSFIYTCIYVHSKFCLRFFILCLYFSSAKEEEFTIFVLCVIYLLSLMYSFFGAHFHREIEGHYNSSNSNAVFAINR